MKILLVAGDFKKHFTELDEIMKRRVRVHFERYFLFHKFIGEELSHISRKSGSNWLLQLEEMYQDEEFIKVLHAQINLVKMKAPALWKYFDYFQENPMSLKYMQEFKSYYVFSEGMPPEMMKPSRFAMRATSTSLKKNNNSFSLQKTCLKKLVQS